MNDILQLVLAALSAVCSLSFCYVVIQLYRSDGWMVLYAMMNPMEGGCERAVRFYHRLIFFGAFVAVGVCLYFGGIALLFWMPNHWGRIDGYGDFVSLKFLINGNLGLLGAVAISRLTCRLVEGRRDHHFNLLIRKESKRITLTFDEAGLKQLLNEYEENVRLGDQFTTLSAITHATYCDLSWRDSYKLDKLGFST